MPPTSTIAAQPHNLLVLPTSPVKQNSNVAVGASSNHQRISFNEIQLRKARGLCFNCDERYTPQHRCPNNLLQWDDNTFEAPITEFLVDPEPFPPLVDQFQSLSLYAMDSSVCSSTIRFIGNLQGHPVKVLMDSGSDDNFIQPRLVKFLRLNVLNTRPFKVLVGNGQTLQVEGFIDEVHLQIQHQNIHFSAFVLPIEGVEIILGAAWLATLGTHLVDYSTMLLQFFYKGNFVALHGEHISSPEISSLH